MQFCISSGITSLHHKGAPSTFVKTDNTCGQNINVTNCSVLSVRGLFFAQHG